MVIRSRGDASERHIDDAIYRPRDCDDATAAHNPDRGNDPSVNRSPVDAQGHWRGIASIVR
jgi:hypothetical protein